MDSKQEAVWEPSGGFGKKAMQVCPCGYLGDPVKECVCTLHQIRRYRARLSGPLMDRLDIHLHVPTVPVQDLANGRDSEPSDTIRTRVTLARRRQTDRYRKERVFSNAQLKPRHLKKYCQIDAEGQNLVERAISQLGLTARAYGRILRVSRTIADLAESDRIKSIHVAEAIQYRTLDRPVIK